MRYEVGQVIPVLFLHTIGVLGYPFFSKHTRENDPLPEVEFCELTVTEHHKVPSEWDDNPQPKLDYDGFILQDKDGEVYKNQYPRAAYSQQSDAADGEFSWGGDYNDEMKEKVRSFDRATKWTHKPLGYYDLLRYLDDFTGLFDFVEKERAKGTEINESYVAHKEAMYEHVIASFHAQYPDKKIETYDFMFGDRLIRKDGLHRIVAA